MGMGWRWEGWRDGGQGSAEKEREEHQPRPVCPRWKGRCEAEWKPHREARCPVWQLSTRNSHSSVANFHHAPLKTCKQEAAHHPQGQLSLRMWPEEHPSGDRGGAHCHQPRPVIRCFPGQPVAAQHWHPRELSLHPSTPALAGGRGGGEAPRILLKKIWESRCRC